jgi:hypothetical protein
LLTLLGLAAAAPGNAHDSWLQPVPRQGAGGLLLLGTGNRFPAYDVGIDAHYLVNPGCTDAAGKRQPLDALRNLPTSLLLRSGAAAESCWLQLTPFDVTVPPDKVPIYLDEVRPPPALLAAWADMQARGRPWQEHYTKHARIALPGPAGDIGPAAAQPAPLGMDMLLAEAVAADGQQRQLQLQVLRDGQPLPALAVELINADQPRPGTWAQTDADGRITLPRPQAGRWLLRAVDLRLATDTPDAWDSRFVTLSFSLR